MHVTRLTISSILRWESDKNMTSITFQFQNSDLINCQTILTWIWEKFMVSRIFLSPWVYPNRAVGGSVMKCGRKLYPND